MFYKQWVAVIWLNSVAIHSRVSSNITRGSKTKEKKMSMQRCPVLLFPIITAIDERQKALVITNLLETAVVTTMPEQYRTGMMHWKEQTTTMMSYIIQLLCFIEKKQKYFMFLFFFFFFFSFLSFCWTFKSLLVLNCEGRNLFWRNLKYLQKKKKKWTHKKFLCSSNSVCFMSNNY